VAPHGRPRADLPEGTVTLLFTDIEGSTRLLRRLGPLYAGVQESHRVLLRDVFARFDGREVDTQGDAFMVAFRSAHETVNAAAEIQRQLAAEPWPDGTEVRVRIGIHTGQPQRGSEGYVGIDVVRAARICSVAHGGQVVLSEATRDVVAPAGTETMDLGTYTLKDLPGSARLYQLLAPGLEREFPVLRTSFATNLPTIPSPLVGRDRELRLIAGLLADANTRLVTLTGTGGAGKSRLALEAARNALHAFPDGVYLVSLAPITDPHLVLAEIARVLGVRDTTSRPRVEALADALRGRRILLVIDNFEHLAGAARDVGQLLRRVPDPVVLATSRRRLRISAEHIVTVGPLPGQDAATLFPNGGAAPDPEVPAQAHGPALGYGRDLELLQNGHGAGGESHAEQPAKEREDDGLGQELPKGAAASGAQGGAGTSGTGPWLVHGAAHAARAASRSAASSIRASSNPLAAGRLWRAAERNLLSRTGPATGGAGVTGAVPSTAWSGAAAGLREMA